MAVDLGQPDRQFPGSSHPNTFAAFSERSNMILHPIGHVGYTMWLEYEKVCIHL